MFPADYSMCTRVHCSWNHYCLRFLAKPHERQAYSDFQIEFCEHFIKVQSHDDVRTKGEAIEALTRYSDGLPS